MTQSSRAGSDGAAAGAPRSARRTLTGRVMSTKMKATITVLVERTYKHEKYGKYVRERKRYHAHDPREEAHTGDLVEIMSTRPISKLKRWRFVRVVQKAVERGEDVTAEGSLALRTEAEA
jgi:small subunit ribosomal protein S17